MTRWLIQTNEAEQFQLLNMEETKLTEGPLLAKTKMGDIRIAGLACPAALYFALQDLHAATPGGKFKAGDMIFFYVGEDPVLIMRALAVGSWVRISVIPSNMKYAFGEIWSHDGRLSKDALQSAHILTACTLEADLPDEEPEELTN